MDAANFRSLFTLGYNQYAKHPKSANQLWPLGIDGSNQSSTMTADEMYARNRDIIASMGEN